MSTNSTIEWTDATWNTLSGCTRISEGCLNCYIPRTPPFRMAHRKFDSPEIGGKTGIILHENRLNLPLHWRNPRRVFVNSLADLFHDDVPTEHIAKVFATMARAERHTFQVLTKRPARMRALLADGGQALLEAVSDEETAFALTDAPWPLPNVWIGTSVESQKWADIRIPQLLRAEAAVRFLSCEPLLGPIDLSAWVAPISPMDPTTAPRSWADWAWPDWVPAEVRVAIENFWSEDIGRGPHAWMRSMHEQGAPAFGSVVTMDDGFARNAPQVTGRYVHAWNNIGRIAMDDGSFKYTSCGHRERERQRGIGWIIVGGESGPGARPMHPDWARQLRNQCVTADVPFFFKQFGEWGLDWPLDKDGRIVAGPRGMGVTVANDGTVYQPGDLAYPDGPRYGDAIRADHNRANLTAMYRLGKHAAGRELDGRTWDEQPLVREAVSAS